MLPAINREYCRMMGANGMQYHHIERTWQQDREFPDRCFHRAILNYVKGGFAYVSAPGFDQV